MTFKVIGTFKSALSRQIFEAVRIRGRGKLALNSRAEYDRCKIHRLTIDKDEEHLQWGEQVHDGTRGNVGDGTEGERVLLDRRKQMDKNNFDGTKHSQVRIVLGQI